MSITYAYAADITKTERDEAGDLLVYGKATGPDLDLDGQICDETWLKGAMPEWFEWGNVREMHQPIAAGVGVELAAEGDDWMVLSKAIDPSTQAKIDAGVLKGYSIGIKNAKVIKDASAPGGRIVGGTIVEVSYVDRPCNPTAKMAICKMVGGELAPVEVPVDEPTEDAAKGAAKGADPELVKRGTDVAVQVRALLPDLDKAAPEQDIADARAAIAAVARLIMSEAEDLAAGRMGEAYQISTLLDAVCALRWFIDCETAETSEILLDAQPDVTKTTGGTLPESTTPDLETLVKAAVAEATAPLVERSKALEAELAKVRSQPVPGGPVLARPVQDIAKAGTREALLAEAQRYERTALALRPSDPNAASGYTQKAASLRAEAAAL